MISTFASTVFDRNVCRAAFNCTNMVVLRAGFVLKSCVRTHVTLENVQFCYNLVRRLDYENFLSVLLLPKQHRTAVLVVRALNVSLSQVTDQVSLPMLAQGRLLFWREQVLDAIFAVKDKPVAQQPVAVVLAEMMKKYGERISPSLLYELVDARSDALSRTPACSSIAQLQQYSQRTHGSVLLLTLEILGARNVNSESVAAQIATAYGLIGMLRSVNKQPIGKLLLPEIARNKKLAKECLMQASECLNNARQQQKSLSRTAKSAFLCALVCDHYIATYGANDCDLYSNKLHPKNYKLPFQLLKQRLLGKF